MSYCVYTYIYVYYRHAHVCTSYQDRGNHFLFDYIIFLIILHFIISGHAMSTYQILADALYHETIGKVWAKPKPYSRETCSCRTLTDTLLDHHFCNETAIIWSLRAILARLYSKLRQLYARPMKLSMLLRTLAAVMLKRVESPIIYDWALWLQSKPRKIHYVK